MTEDSKGKVQVLKIAQKLKSSLLDQEKPVDNRNFVIKYSALLTEVFGELRKRGREKLFSDILDELIKLLRSDLNDNIAIVQTPFELEKSQVDLLEKKLSRIFASQIIVNQQIDNEISGGLIIYYKDKVVDLSIDKKVSELRNKLIQ